MGDAGFFKGTSSEQVDMRKVELSVMRPWITDKIMELLGFEDEVVVEYVNGLLDDPPVQAKTEKILSVFEFQITGPFMSELWALLLSAQKSPLKVPALFIEQKKEEMRKKRSGPRGSSFDQTTTGVEEKGAQVGGNPTS
ncbi:hypothetical protein H4Q26_014138 [Puccinia striiformis f. sp. tritici PST-130]|nr:hypothetical protein H4Q26_014138 [Puccinia striiformis f. sp. tritici PST-130]